MQKGLRYTNMYTTALCSPPRACVLTGRNHHFNRVAYVMECATGFTDYDDRMPFQNGMLSEMLLEHGYNTSASWTQTRHEQSGKEKPNDLDRD